MRRLTIASLETASTIARLGSFTAAATCLNTTQPAISARIRELEHALNFKLFVRHRRGVEVTLEGREFLREAEPLLRELDNLANPADRGTFAGSVRLGTSSLALGLVGRLATLAKRDMPELSLSVQTGSAGLLLHDIHEGRLDVAIVTGPVDQALYRCVALTSNELIWAVSGKLYEAYRAQPISALFGSLPIWCIGKGSFSWSETVAVLREHGIVLGAINELPSAVALTKIISEGGGVGYLSKTSSEMELESGVLRQIPELSPAARVDVTMVCRHDRATHRVLANILELGAKIGDQVSQ